MALAGLTSGAAVAVVTAMWATVYGIGPLRAIRALAASLWVVSSALGPAAMGWLIDAGAPIDAIAMGCAAYLLGANLLLLSPFSRPATSRSA